MSVNQEALQKLLMEMDTQLQKTQAELQMCNLQLNRANTNLRITSLTIEEISSTPDNTRMWQGVGKVFININKDKYIQELNAAKKDIDDSVKSMGLKKVYLETTLEKTVDGMNQFVGGR